LSEPTQSQPQEPTLGQLLCSAITDERSREHNRHVLDRVAARSSVEAHWFGAQIAALESFDPWAGVPAALWLRGYANREFGQDLTPHAVMRIRGRVCEVLDINTDVADALPLSRVVEVLREADKASDSPGTDSVSQYRWLRVRQVASLFNLNPGVVTKNADAGIFITNGKTGYERRIDILSVVQWELARLNQQDMVVTDD